MSRDPVIDLARRVDRSIDEQQHASVTRATQKFPRDREKQSGRSHRGPGDVDQQHDTRAPRAWPAKRKRPRYTAVTQVVPEDATQVEPAPLRATQTTSRAQTDAFDDPRHRSRRLPFLLECQRTSEVTTLGRAWCDAGPYPPLAALARLVGRTVDDHAAPASAMLGETLAQCGGRLLDGFRLNRRGSLRRSFA
jgi:hypothetical protein